MHHVQDLLHASCRSYFMCHAGHTSCIMEDLFMGHARPISCIMLDIFHARPTSCFMMDLLHASCRTYFCITQNLLHALSGLTPRTDRLSPDQSDSPPPNWNKKTINYKMTGGIDNGHFKGPKNADDVP